MTYSIDDERGQHKLKLSAQVENFSPIPCKDYSLIVADPPWRYQLRETDQTHRNRTPYPTMSDEEILDLPIGIITHANAYCLLWCTANHQHLAFHCLEQWGFKHKATHVWVKTVKDGSKPRIGVGHYGRNCAEFLLVGIKGKPGSFTTLGLTNIPTVMMEPATQHSRKPEIFYQQAKRLHNALGGKAIELFARRQVFEDWDVWGLEI